MGFVINVLITLLHFLSVHTAAVLNFKREIALNVQACSNNVDIFATQIGDLLKNIETESVFTEGRSYDDYLEDIMDMTETSCCGIHAVISDTDADHFLASVGTLTPKVQTVLSALTERQAGYNGWTKFIVRGQLRSMDAYTLQLASCFAVFSPETKKPVLQGYMDQLKSALTSAKTAYNADSWF